MLLKTIRNKKYKIKICRKKSTKVKIALKYELSSETLRGEGGEEEYLKRI